MSCSNLLASNQKINDRYLPNPYPFPAFPSGLPAVLTVDNRAGDGDIVEINQLEVRKVVSQPLLGEFLEIGGAGGDLRINGATTKGSILAGNGTSTVGLPVGATGYVLKSNPATATGLEWGIDISGVTGVVGVNAGANIDISGTVSQPIVSLQNPLTSTLNLGSQSMTAGDPLIPLTFNSTTDKNGVTYNEGAILSANYSANSMSIVNTTGIGSLQASSGSITLADTSVGTSTVNNISTPTDIQVTSLDNIGGGIQRTTVGDNDITILNTDAGTPIVTKTSVYGCCIASETATDVSTSESTTHTITTNANGITESSLVQGGGTSITTSATTATTGAGFSRQWGDVTGNQTSIGTNQNGSSASSSNGVVSTISGTLTSISTQIASDTTSARETVSYSQISPAGLSTFVQSTADNVRAKTRHTYIPTPSGPLTLVDNEAGSGGCVLRHTASAVVTDITTSSPFGTQMIGTDSIGIQAGNLLNLVGTSQAVVQGQGATLTCASNQTTLNATTVVSFSSANASASSPNFIFQAPSTNPANYPAIKIDKSGFPTVAGETIGSISMWAKDGAGTSTEWTRLQTKTENVTPAGNRDGTLSIFNIVDGTLAETFNFNGGQNENNSFRPLDMNGNNIRTTSGNIAIDATSSSGTGNISLLPKSLTGNITMTCGGAGGAGNITGTTVNGNIALSTSGLGDILIDAEDTARLRGKAGLTLETTAISGVDLAINSTRSVNITANSINSAGNRLNINTGTNGGIALTGASLESGTASGNSGNHLVITLNGVVYKIALLNP